MSHVNCEWTKGLGPWGSWDMESLNEIPGDARKPQRSSSQAVHQASRLSKSKHWAPGGLVTELASGQNATHRELVPDTVL